VELYIDRGKPKNSEKNLSQCHFVQVVTLLTPMLEVPGSNPVPTSYTLTGVIVGFLGIPLKFQNTALKYVTTFMIYQ
jgi:hypothetical protein